MATQANNAPEKTLLTPALDIFEQENQVTIIAELPGVNNDNVNIQLQDQILTIEGVIALATADGEQQGHEEVTSPYYATSLQLGRDLDSENIGADFKDGLLTVKIAKKAWSQPYKIDVKFT
ncbi:Hsp20/alpha crystallin family protein [Thalassomonas haliotis]|uniref:Hsp20/alpha crystallin family protein n=1 Tax=Thalassomonas haliotis TaxID=485448 RepID=A0ABY7VAK7_9GAMM|nr:Hsp20/alpha crystallin family protein [Thalassomonas haliotis]WDE10417.1 Hsp20/alpha crystallin family protein [Thalassomonas haliotis]